MVPYIGATVTIRQEVVFTAADWMESSRTQMVEDTMHLWQHGLGRTYPAVFGVKDDGCPADMKPGRGASLHDGGRRRVRRLRGDERRTSASPILHRNGSRRLQLDASNCPYGQHVKGCNWQTSLLLKCGFLAMCNWFTADM